LKDRYERTQEIFLILEVLLRSNLSQRSKKPDKKEWPFGGRSPRQKVKVDKSEGRLCRSTVPSVHWRPPVHSLRRDDGRGAREKRTPTGAC